MERLMSAPRILQTTVGSLLLLSPLFATAETQTSTDTQTSAEKTATVELDSVKVQGDDTPLAEISTDKLLRVPGSGNDPLRAIESLPGVVFSSGRRSEPAVRGSSPEDNAYIIDFLPVGYIFHQDGSSILNDNVVKDFKLEAAAFGPEYNNATGAVIDADSRLPYQDRDQTIIDFSLLKAGIFVENQVTDNQAFYFSARQSLFQYYIENFLDDEDFKFTQVPEFYDYQGKYTWRISNNENLTFQVIGAQDKGGILFDEDSDEVLQDPGLKGGLRYKAFFNTQGLVWDKLYDSGLTHKIGFSQLEEKFGFGIGQENRIDVKVNSYHLRSQFSYPINFDHELQWGLQLKEAHIGYNGQFNAPACDEFDPDCRIVDGSETIKGKGKPIVTTWYASVADVWSVTPTWTLTPGVLVSSDDYTKQDFTEPKLNSRWEFRENWAFTSGYGQYHILPDNFGSYTPEFGNRNLKQPTADHYEIGIENELADDLLWKVEAYYKNLDDIIIARPDPDFYGYDLSKEADKAAYNALPRYTNDADGTAWGMEFFINKNLTDKWYGWLSAAYSRTERKDQLTNKEFRYNYDQPVIINMVANYQYNKHWQIGFKWRYQSGQLITPLLRAEQDKNDPKLYNPVYGETNSQRLPAYHKLDVRADRTFVFKTWEMDFYAEILNLYGRSNVVDYEYEGADYSNREEVTDLPTIVSFGIKAKL
ncbi:TonB-dependent receptor plug domain-containing protein [Bacterioplanoides sp.]|uniref:TonB-dependent receptor plug domain-containing protein n=1 Tax=Bacterioplanoides sp. TaxID=2066072 RepID=UPI003B5A1B5D